jgi:putative FmdB family regulatory protein
MPYYEHKCNKCKKVSELLYSVKKDPKEVECPLCGSKDTTRLISHSNIGWEGRIYKTFVRAEDERAEAMATDHMGPNGGYNPLSGEPQEEG